MLRDEGRGLIRERHGYCRCPAVSVIIPTYNSRTALLQCLETLHRQTVPPHTFEILVVDDGSTDGTSPAVRQRFPDVRVVVTPHRGGDNARLCGVSDARGEIALFTDADCIPRSDWVERAVEGLSASADIIAGRVRHGDSFLERVIAIADFGDFQCSRPSPIANFAFCNVGMPRGVAQAHMPEIKLRTGGDRVLSWRLNRLGYRIRYDPRLEVAHRPRLDLRSLLNRRCRYSYNAIVARLEEPSLPGGAYVRHRWILPFAFPMARLVRDLRKLARVRRDLGLNLLDALALSAGLGALRLWD